MAKNTDIIYEPNGEELSSGNDRDARLVSWVMGKVSPWADYRDTNHKDKWEEYTRLWRGIWAAEDQTRKTERSRLISPAIAQAVEVATAEVEEAVFGKGRWFDIEDDKYDEDKQDVERIRNLLLEDLNRSGVPQAMSEVFLNSCLYGTGIGKIAVEEVQIAKPVTVNSFGFPEASAQITTEIRVKLIPIQPDQFVIDPAARSIEESLGVAHEMMVPRHNVTKKQRDGIYKDVKLGSLQDDLDLTSDDHLRTSNEGDEVKITEWHGLVPSYLIDPDLDEDEEIEEFGIDYDAIDDYDLVEAIVTIGNESTLLKAVENPYTMGDRSILAFQYDTIPNQFWGRGIVEKGYNSQKALDAELRGRMDAMALAIHPMMAMDATRVPRGGDLSIRPGKTLLTNGNPRDILMPFNFGQVGTNTFQQSGDLERMIQMATGAMDSAAPMSSNAALSTASGMSMMMSGSIKRSKRNLLNIKRGFVTPLVNKASWRYMQFDPERYPAKDYKYIVHTTLGIMARELETQQLTSLLQTVEKDSPAFWMLIKGIYENSTISDRDQMLMYANQMLQQSMQPQPNPELELRQQQMQFENQKDMAKLQIEKSRADTERMRVEKELLAIEPSIQKTQQESRATQIKSNIDIRAQEVKEKELELKERKMMLDAEIERLKMDQQNLRDSEAKLIKPEPMRPPVININGSSKKKITVTRTDDGLEGISEEVE